MIKVFSYFTKSVGFVICVCFGVLVFLSSCTNPTPEELASIAAKGYYDHLLRGEYDHFLEGKIGIEELPLDYREQLLTSYRQFMSKQKIEHHGIGEVIISRASTDSLENYTNVFLMLCYGDSTNEEIVVPMVEKEGRWRMK